MLTLFRKSVKKIVAILFIIAMFLSCQNEAFAAISRVSSTTCFNTSATTIACTLTVTPTNGNALIAVIGTRGATTGRVTNITQSGATWVKAIEVANANGNTSEIWYALNVSGAVAGVTINLAATLRASAVIAEYSGIASVGALDKTSSTTGNSASPSTGTTVTTAQASELWVGALDAIGTPTYSNPTNSFSIIGTSGSTGGSSGNREKSAFLERIVSATGAASTGATLSASGQWAGTIATFVANVAPTVTSPTSSAITTTTATIGATVTSLGIPASISARGTCLGTTPAPTNCSPEGGTTTGTFTQNWIGMTPGTLYYYRGYATNTTGTGYSSDGTFTTASPPSGTVSANPTSCTISSGASTCTAPFTWSISNATSPNLYNSTTANQYSTSAAGSGVSYPITNGTNTVQVRDSSTVLNSTAVTGSCTAGTTWNGTVCAVNTFTIFASSGANGSVTPTGTTTVTQGASQFYNIAPNSGYDVATLLIDGGSVATSTSYTFTSVQTNHTISATFILLPTPPATFTIFASSGANGSVTPTGTTTVTQGNSQAYSITPNSGYNVATLLVDGGSVATSTSYTFTNVQTNHTISATFSLIPITHTITSSAGSGGSISPLGATVVADGASQIFNINPDSGFTTETLVVDSVSIATSTSYTFNNVLADHTISATFALIPPPPGSFAIIATAGAHGTVLPSGSTAVTQGNSQAYTITPDSGYDVGTLLIDSFPVATTTSYTFTNVQTAHTIEATFVTLPSPEAPTVGNRWLASITFSGKAFPGGTVSIVHKELDKEIISNQQDVSNANGFFNLRFIDLPEGIHSFGLLAKDSDGRISQSKFFLLDARHGDETYKDIVFPPTIDLFSGQVSRGGKLKVLGYASPGHTIRVYLDDILSKEVLAGNGGAYSFELPTGALDFGKHKVRAKQVNLDGGKESDFSPTKTFIVSKLAVVKADFNGDGKIDIKDWSIFLARFTSRDKELRASVDLNGDGKTDISDFSIFIKTIKKK